MKYLCCFVVNTAIVFFMSVKVFMWMPSLYEVSCFVCSQLLEYVCSFYEVLVLFKVLECCIVGVVYSTGLDAEL